MNSEVNRYIERRYGRWLDYSKYHCSLADIPDEAADVLNEVILSLLEKDEKKILKMYNSTKDGHRELDFFVLRMIKLNAHSPTSPYQNKYKKRPFGSDIEFSRLNIPDEHYEDDDKPARILAQYNLVREVFENLNIPAKERRIFHHRFFMGLSFSCWEGAESKNELYRAYNRVLILIKQKIAGKEY